jgi:branched-chain amino acid transport system substrate-binding protein
MHRPVVMAVAVLMLTAFLLLPVSCRTAPATKKPSITPPAAAPRKSSGPNVKVGLLLPMSGDLADKGQDCLRGFQLAIDEINAQGGIASLGHAPFEAVLADSQGDPARGAAEAKRLIETEGVAAICGAYQSSVTRPATQVAEQYETPFIVETSSADIITERGFRYTFRVAPKAQFYGRDQTRFLLDLPRLGGPRVKRVALIHENTDFGTSMALAQKQALRAQGFTVVAEASYREAGIADLRAEVAQILKAKPDVILEVTYLKSSILIHQALAAAKSKALLIDTAGGTVSPEYQERLGQQAEGTLSSSEYSIYTPQGQALNGRFRHKFGVDITGDSAYSYQAVLVLKDALERCATTEHAQLREALAGTDLPRGPAMVFPAQRLRFDAFGQNESAQLFMIQIQDGKWVPVWPAEYATARLRLAE